MMSLKKKVFFVPLVIVIVVVLAFLPACKGKGSSAADVSGELTFMTWAGDDKYYPDIGGMDLKPQDITEFSVAAIYAVAKEYKKLYPNVKINFYGKPGGGNDDDGTWEQHRENFRMKFGVTPDIYTQIDYIGGIQKGYVADLTKVIRNDPLGRTLSPWLMDILNVEGRTFSLPFTNSPTGIMINKSLAEVNNIDVPDPNWNIAEYTSFINHSRPNDWYGSMGNTEADMFIINTGSKDFSYMLNNRKPGEPFVNINSDASRSLLRYVSQWMTNSVWPQLALGNISSEFMDEHWWWSLKFFIDGKVLVNNEDTWAYADVAHPNPEHWAAMQGGADWDIYPRPSTDYMGNTVGIEIVPIVIRNYAMDDGNPALSAEEEAKLKLAYDFLMFYLADTRGWQARVTHEYYDQGTLPRYPLTFSLPAITGPEFDKQMEIFYTPEMHQRFKDKAKMPGWHYILDLWNNGQIWDVPRDVYPWYYDFEGERRVIPYEWENAFTFDVSGAERTDPNWLDQVYSRLPQWNTTINQRWANEFQNLENALNRYYPIQ